MKKPGDIRKQAKRLTAGQINRRRFVMSALATGVTLPTAMSLATKAEAQMPRPGGHLIATMRSGQDFDALLGFATGNTLTEIAGDGEIVGDLARGFHAENGGSVWVFDLHRNVTFGDGSPMDASHVVECLKEAALPSLSLVQGISQSGSDRIIITLTHPDMGFPARLADRRLTIRHWDERGQSHGTGGYVVEHASDEKHVLRRRADYWKAGRAHFDGVTLVLAGSAAALQADVMSGKVHYAAGIAPETVAFLSHLPDVQVAHFPATRALVLHATGHGTAPGASDAIRALRSGVDRRAFVDRALLGHGLPGDDTPLPPATSLPSAGVIVPKNGQFAGSLEVSSDSGKNWLPHLTDIAKRIGVQLDVGLSSGSGSGFHATTLTADTLGGWLTSDPQVTALFTGADDAHGRLRRGLEAARVLPDTAARKREIALACSCFADSDRLFIPAWANDLAAHSRKLAHPARMTPHQPNDGHRLIERWWFA